MVYLDWDCWDWVIGLTVLAATVGVLVTLFFAPPPAAELFP